MIEAHRLSESEEDYIATIYSLVQEHRDARVTDIAAKLNVKSPSVTSMLQKLDEQKFVNYTRYKGVTLTQKGKQLAETLAKRHQALKKFLIMIWADEESAEKTVCEIEHKIDSETVEKLAKFVEFVESAPQTPQFLEHFKHYDRTGKRPEHCRVESEVNKNHGVNR